jgi:hypothetical protein
MRRGASPRSPPGPDPGSRLKPSIRWALRSGGPCGPFETHGSARVRQFGADLRVDRFDPDPEARHRQSSEEELPKEPGRTLGHPTPDDLVRGQLPTANAPSQMVTPPLRQTDFDKTKLPSPFRTVPARRATVFELPHRFRSIHVTTDLAL